MRTGVKLIITFSIGSIIGFMLFLPSLVPVSAMKKLKTTVIDTRLVSNRSSKGPIRYTWKFYVEGMNRSLDIEDLSRGQVDRIPALKTIQAGSEYSFYLSPLSYERREINRIYEGNHLIYKRSNSKFFILGIIIFFFSAIGIVIGVFNLKENASVPK